MKYVFLLEIEDSQQYLEVQPFPADTQAEDRVAGKGHFEEDTVQSF